MQVLKALLQKDNEIVNTNTPTYFKDMAAMISQGASPVVNDSEVNANIKTSYSGKVNIQGKLLNSNSTKKEAHVMEAANVQKPLKTPFRHSLKEIQ